MKALKKLLTSLDKIMDKHEEIGDTDVREQMYEAVYHGFIKQAPNYELPNEFGMFKPDGNERVRKALKEFIEAGKAEAIKMELDTPEARFAAFQNPNATGRDDITYDEYFGHADDLSRLAKMCERQKPPT